MPRPFVIGFVARSGSSALAFDLRQHPEIQMHLEVFGERTLGGFGREKEQTDDNRIAWLQHYWRAKKNANIARGFKFQFQLGEPQFDDLSRLGSTLRDLNPVIFRLRRIDVIRHAVAVFRAHRLQSLNLTLSGHSGAHVYADDREEIRRFVDEPIAVNTIELEVLVQSLSFNRAYMDAFMAGFPNVVDLTYEDYLRDRLAVLNTITDAIEVERFSEAPPSTLMKNSSNDLRLAVSNYDELAAAAQRLGLAI